MNTLADLSNAAAASGRAGLIWRTADGGLDAATVTPLRFADTIAFSLAFDRTPLARALSSARAVALAVNDDRLVSAGWTPMVGSVDLDIAEDREGAWMAKGLLDQELRRYPPARQLIDTPMLRRDHWWYLPRWIVTVTRASGVRHTEPVSGPRGGVVAIPDAGAVLLFSATLDPAHPRLEGLPSALLPGAPARVLFHGHVADGPGLDRTSDWTLWFAPRSRSGATTWSDLHVVRERGTAVLRPPDSLLTRVRRHRRLHRRCRMYLDDPRSPEG